ncbi:MAG: response regulator [Flavobacteriales bacterium]|nr:response regulator [Flavobacteriales bacterium]
MAGNRSVPILLDNWMNKHFEFRIAAIMLVALALVSITGIYAYRQFSHVVTELGKDALPDLRLSTTKSVMNGLADAENSVKSFNLTNDSIYLKQFAAAIERTEHSVQRLEELTSADAEFQTELDSVRLLIYEKVDVLNRWLKLSDPYRADVALNKAVLRLEMGKDESDSNTQKADQVTVEDVSRAVQKVKKEEALVERIMREQEMNLIAENNRITERVREKLATLEQRELQRLAYKTQSAEKTVNETNLQMALFFVSMGFLLLIMAFVILGYTRNNNRYRKALRSAKEQAEEMARARERFLANMSHEIRTPMNAIAGFTEQLATSKLDPVQQEQLSMVQKSTDHLLHVINEILDLTKLQSDKLQLENVGFRLRETIDEAVSIIQPLALQKGLKLSVSVADEVPKVVLGDAYRLRQMLLNLLGNAVKFTDKGSVSVYVKAISNGIEISVSDTGVGMAEAQISKVFEEFEQAEASTTRNYGGTGLGLSIVNRLVNLHGGEIRVKSELQKGTEITLGLPYKAGSEADISKSVSSVSVVESLNGLNVLIVDDEPFNRKLLSTILKKHGANFEEASNGKEALEKAETPAFNLILMDARMPEMGGLEATKAIRNLTDPNKNSTPIIILSAAVTLEDREEYEAARTNGFLAKPFKENELLAIIGQVIGGSENLSTESKSSPENNTELDFSELMEMSGNDESFFHEMLQTFFDGTKKGLEDIREALTAKERLQVAEHAHRISAPCKHVSAIRLYQELKKLEEEGRGNADIEALEEHFLKIDEEAKSVLKQVEKRLNL